MIALMPMQAPRLTADPRGAAVIAYFESLTPDALERLDTVYCESARFIDPFNDVTGIPGIRRVFDHMFATLDTPRFEVLHAMCEGDQCFLVWDFHFRRNPNAPPMHIHGASHLRFAGDRRVAWHRDYWDTGRELYEGLPLLGSVLRWLRRRLSAGS